MSRPVTLLLLFWNLVLSIIVGYLLTRGRTPVQLAEDDGRADIGQVQQEEEYTLRPDTDTLVLADARIAYFNMDSVQQGYTLVKESADRVRAEARKLEGDLQREIQKAQARAQELAQKDHTYSTQAQLQADQEEFQNLQIRIQELRERSQDRFDEMQMRMLSEIGREIEGFLTEYNSRAGFDYIFSIQDGGQIWVGNDRLDITREVVNGLNARHRASKAAPK